ncbi:tripartite tricarboxylate transporter TctB family protein [Corticibacterium sp. UT-5YL-CI-8]|nr:tripartite tricarboxylate transporter TctB family protein [Tianweitania sp. UT-5YL-CI-8]
MIPLRSFDFGLSAILALLGLYIVSQGISFGYQDGAVPAAGFFPFWIGAGLALFSGLNLIRLFRHSGVLGAVDRMEIVRVGLVSLALCGFVILSGFIGMIGASVLLMIAVGMVFGARDRRSILAVSAIAVGMAGILYLVFGVVLTIPLL